MKEQRIRTIFSLLRTPFFQHPLVPIIKIQLVAISCSSTLIILHEGTSIFRLLQVGGHVLSLGFWSVSEHNRILTVYSCKPDLHFFFSRTLDRIHPGWLHFFFLHVNNRLIVESRHPDQRLKSSFVGTICRVYFSDAITSAGVVELRQMSSVHDSQEKRRYRFGQLTDSEEIDCNFAGYCRIVEAEMAHSYRRTNKGFNLRLGRIRCTANAISGQLYKLKNDQGSDVTVTIWFSRICCLLPPKHEIADFLVYYRRTGSTLSTVDPGGWSRHRQGFGQCFVMKESLRLGSPSKSVPWTTTHSA